MIIASVFGSSVPVEGQEDYRIAEKLGADLALAEFSIATGGYSGTMEAVSKGAAKNGATVYGVTCDLIEGWRGGIANEWISDEIHCKTLRERLEKLVDMGDVLIALPGGIGTLAEVAVSWSWLQTGELSPRPLILVGEGWASIVETLYQHTQGYILRDDRDLLTIVPDAEQAVVLAANWQNG